MKIRTDFVSNSSSSSFVVACKKDFLKDVVKDLAKACSSRVRSQCHDKNLSKRNQCILQFCLQTFQLAFLGELLVETKEETYSLDSFKKILAISSKTASSDIAEKEWERYKKTLNDIKNGNSRVPKWMKREYDLDEYDAATDTAKHIKKVYAKDVVVSNDVMEYRFDRYIYASPDTEDIIKQRVACLIDFAKSKIKKDANKEKDFVGSIDIYQITKNTINNTRNLISCGYKIDFAKWENLDELDAKLEYGDAIFYVRIAHSGDGYGDFYIYCEDDADGLNGVSGIEILTSDCI